MSIEAQIFSSLKSLVSNRCYPNTFPQSPTKPTWPAIRYVRVATNINQDLIADEDDETSDIIIQIDVVGQTYASVQLLREQVIEAMKMLDPKGVWQNQFDTFDAETKTHRCILTFAFYQSSDDGANSPTG